MIPRAIARLPETERFLVLQNRLNPRLHSELEEDAVHVGLDSRIGQEECLRDLRIPQTLGY